MVKPLETSLPAPFSSLCAPVNIPKSLENERQKSLPKAGSNSSRTKESYLTRAVSSTQLTVSLSPSSDTKMKTITKKSRSMLPMMLC